jgi:hypothetical protein
MDGRAVIPSEAKNIYPLSSETARSELIQSSKFLEATE